MKDVTPTIEGTTGPYGIKITDPIENAQFTLLTSGPVQPIPADEDRFPAPIDTAASVSVTELETPYLANVLVRDGDMNLVAQCTSSESVSVDPGRYYLEVGSAKMKLYLTVDSGVDIEPRDEQVRLSFPGANEVVLGARSFHESPAATIQTTTAPDDIATALSHLGSALKTTSCERSFPTLRGHPPLIELGNEIEIPDTVESPDTGVTIEVPPYLDYLFPTASLAYYFGATVETSPDPVLIANGESFPLDDDGDFEDKVARVLQQAFLLDCITRTEGYYDVDLHERRLVESAIDIDIPALYDKPLGAQLQSYLQIPYDAIADAVPTWKLTADVVPDPDHVPALPFLAEELTAIRCPNESNLHARSLDNSTPEVRSFFRAEPGFVRGSDTSSLTRTSNQSGMGDAALPDDKLVFEPPPADSIEQTYIGSGIPMGASKVTVNQLYRRLNVEPTTDERIRVLVVCNDAEMSEENAVGEIYGVREWVEFDITTREQVTINELISLLQEPYDFVHYIGHVDDDGVRCTDGHLDTRTLSEVNVGAFLLNACQSYDQGQGLIDAGALGGIVTLTEVLNRTATEIGRTVSHLLNQGFSLLSMLDLLEAANPLAQRYMVVGDGNISIVESESGAPMSVSIEGNQASNHQVDLFSYPSKNYHIGSIIFPHINDEKTCYLSPGPIGTFKVTKEQLEAFLDLDTYPVRINDTLHWSNELDIFELV